MQHLAFYRKGVYCYLSQCQYIMPMWTHYFGSSNMAAIKEQEVLGL